VRARLAIACLAAIAVADCLITRRHPPWLVIGLFDEPAHLATGVLVGGLNLPFLAGAMLPDLDHVPLAFQAPERGDPRPKTHSIYTALPAALVSRPLATGMQAHLARDLALDPGVPLFGGRHLRVPYGAYALLILAAAYGRSRR
jgi:hypothetical protein